MLSKTYNPPRLASSVVQWQVHEGLGIMRNGLHERPLKQKKFSKNDLYLNTWSKPHNMLLCSKSGFLVISIVANVNFECGFLTLLVKQNFNRKEMDSNRGSIFTENKHCEKCIACVYEVEVVCFIIGLL